ncbi:hypothetical protein [Edaphobacter modestus]|uniref:hypothetical protein n=1 Tax=Edaphobacter modestus TaxID=388466 RepID=UPI00102BAE20|nr:hypothetical protein [Edaphobacter modestus]
MATKRKPPPKAEPTVSVEERLIEALAQKPKSESIHDHPAAVQVGDKVTVGDGESIWTVSRVSSDGNQVDLHIPETNLQRFRVLVDDLEFVERTQHPKPSKPAEPEIDVDEVRKRIASARGEFMEHFDEQIKVLKKFLKSHNIPAKELDELRMDIEDRWSVAEEAIMGEIGE